MTVLYSPRSWGAFGSAITLALVLAACSATTGDGGGPSPSPAATTSPSPSLVPPASAAAIGSPSEGDCVETDQPIGPLTALTVFRVAPCLSPLARYRVLTVMTVGIPCPNGTGYTLDRSFQRFCLTDQLSGEPTPAIDFDVAISDCITLQGELFIESLARVDCGSTGAQYRVLDVFDSIVPECPSGTDNKVTLTQPLGPTGGGMKVLCLKAL